MNVKACIAVTIWLVAPVKSPAQHWSFQTYGTDAGLTNLNILALHQDRQGFIWVSTEGGLFRYDGDRFRPFAVSSPGKAAVVSSLHTSSDGQLWAGSVAGLFRWSGDRFLPVPSFANVELKSGEAISSDDSRLYVASPAGVWSMPLSATESPKLLTSTSAASVFVSRDHIVWFGCGPGLCTLQSPDGPASPVPSGPVATSTWSSIIEDSSGQIWIRSPDRIMLREKPGGNFREIARLTATHNPLLTTTRRGEVLVPHSAGLAICTSYGCQNYGVESGLQNTELLTVDEDREGSFWIGYSGHGLARWLGREEWENFSELEGLSDSQIWRIVRDRRGDLWVGTNRGLFRGSTEAGRWKFHRSDILGAWTVYGLLADPDGSLWLGTFQSGLNGLVHYDPATGRKTVYPPPHPVPEFAISGLSQDASGSIWVTTRDKVFKLNPGSRQMEDVSLPGTDATVHGILHQGGALYISGRNGLYIQRDGVGRLFTVADGLKDNAIQSVAVGPEGEIWIAYYAPLGLSRLDLNGGHWNTGKVRLRHFSVSEGLPSNVVYSQFFDARGRHWIGTDNGAAIFDGRRWIRYDTLDGLVWNDCNAGAYLAEPDGAVWIGTSAGMSRYFPSPQFPPPVPSSLITAVMRNDAPASGTDFDSNTHSLALRFTMLSYHRANPLFRYRLGSNRPWIQTQEREVHFAELPPGAYHFEVQGATGPNTWSHPATRDFQIRPPWYLAPGFVFGAPAAFMGLIWLGWRRREKMQRKIRENLEAAVLERTRSLAAAMARAEQESRFKGEFLANMSHEMRTPLTGVLGITKLALELSNQPEVIRHLTTVQFSANVLLSLINDVLDLAKIEAGMLNIAPVAFSPRVLLEETLLMLEAEAKNKGLELELAVDSTVPEWVLADDCRLRQILINLIGNALKFTQNGSVKVSVRHDGSKLHCSVSDTGIGIAPAKQALIFEAFRQADSSTSRSYGGSGLGLAISRNLVDAMGGSIGVQSEPGRGSTFSFDILAPKTAPPRTTAEKPQPQANSPGRPLRILVAEDNKVNQHLITALLRKHGHHLVIANNGQEAVAACARERFDLVLMDIQMPEMDGIQAVKLIRKAEAAAGNRVPVVAVTARALPGDREEMLNAGMDDYLEKPIPMDRLEAILSRLPHAGNATAEETLALN
jgi:signal transduction histidine kinase/ligand-binding sensor domain-containing protein/CheY-like chemotaxis protein